MVGVKRGPEQQEQVRQPDNDRMPLRFEVRAPQYVRQDHRIHQDAAVELQVVPVVHDSVEASLNLGAIPPRRALG